MTRGCHPHILVLQDENIKYMGQKLDGMDGLLCAWIYSGMSLEV